MGNETLWAGRWVQSPSFPKHQQPEFSAPSASGKREQLWLEFFSDPSQWRDNRLTKKSPKHPDFEHRTTLEALWVDGLRNPTWVKEKVATLAFDYVQTSRGVTAGFPDSSCDDDKVRELCEEGRLKEAIYVVKLMVQQNCQVPRDAFVCLLKACATRKALAEGKQVHALMVQSRCDSVIFLANHLIDMYAKCGSLPEAHKVFAAMSRRNLFSWTAIILAYVYSSQYQEAVNLSQEMQDMGIAPDKVLCVIILKACAKIGALEQGKKLHSLILKGGFASDMIIQTNLVDMYAKCGSIEDALELFNNMIKRDVFSWNAMIAGYLHHGLGKEALDMYERMEHEDVQPDIVTFVLALKACASVSALEKGKQLHAIISKKEIEPNIIVQNTLIDMYAKCGCLEDARELFDNMNERDIVSWNVIISGYAQNGCGKEALGLYEQMKHEGLQPDIITFVLLLKACASISALEQGKQLHSIILKNGIVLDLIGQNTLIDMYVKCGSLEDAREVFNNMTKRNVFSWNIMISGYAQNAVGKEALDLYERMKYEDIEPDIITFVLVLKACASISALEKGKQIHSLILEQGFESDLMVQSSLVDMYAKCGCVEDAHEVFKSMTRRDVVSWNVMIAAYVQNGLATRALALYEQMEKEGVQPDEVTFLALLKAIASISSLEKAKQLHSLILKRGCESYSAIQISLVDMYAKCGCLEDAHDLFNNMKKRDVVSWNAIIAGYAQNGLGKEALALYKQMKLEGFQPNQVTYICVLSACNHSGLVDEGCEVFEALSKDHDFTPTLDQYACMVDLLGRAGRLADAEDFILKMPIRPNKQVWMSLLGAARKHGNVEIGKRAFDSIVKLGSEDSAPYMLLMDIYSAASKMDELGQIRKEMKEREICNEG